MSTKGQPSPRRVTPSNTAAKKQHVLDLIAEGRTYTDACRVAEVSKRTFVNWKQRDERFVVGLLEADRARRDALVDWHWRVMNDDTGYWPPKERWSSACFLTKQADPSFRDNHKIEHVVSGGLAGALKQLAKMGRE